MHTTRVMTHESCNASTTLCHSSVAHNVATTPDAQCSETPTQPRHPHTCVHTLLSPMSPRVEKWDTTSSHMDDRLERLFGRVACSSGLSGGRTCKLLAEVVEDWARTARRAASASRTTESRGTSPSSRAFAFSRSRTLPRPMREAHAATPFRAISISRPSWMCRINNSVASEEESECIESSSWRSSARMSTLWNRSMGSFSRWRRKVGLPR